MSSLRLPRDHFGRAFCPLLSSAPVVLLSKVVLLVRLLMYHSELKGLVTLALLQYRLASSTRPLSSDTGFTQEFLPHQGTQVGFPFFSSPSSLRRTLR